MTTTEIRTILENPYDRSTWRNFIKTQFTNNKLLGEERTFTLQNNNLAKECYFLGNYEIDQYTKIGIFEIQLTKNVNLTRNRVALRNLIKHITQQMAGAMVVFVQEDKWRFSYISKRKVKNNETQSIEDQETAPKRYTYLFGKGEKALTAAQWFTKLIEKQKANLFQNLTLNDFEEAFNVEKLSEEFFAKYKDIYEDFVEYLTGKRIKKSGNRYVEKDVSEPNYQLKSLFENNETKARDFCKRMMGRIVFLYFIQKKGWLACPLIENENKVNWGAGDQDFMFNLFSNSKNKIDFYRSELYSLFFKTLNNPESEKPQNIVNFKAFPYLNGGLFDETQDKKYINVVLPESIFNNLFEIFNSYNFTVYEDAPEEHTIAVDPEMLGHIFENLLEDNKDKGAYYTPKEIVHYMCQESLMEYLIANLNFTVEYEKSSIYKIIHQKELEEKEKIFVEKNAFKIIDALEQVKICDPAIGSGAFPMGILQEIFNLQIYLQELKGFKKNVTDADIKKHIIQESIYGVDIEPGAVDIARLRFWLSLVVDEKKPQPLPNLDFKIICANSIIELGNIQHNDVSGNYQIVEQMVDISHKYFNASKNSKAELEKSFNDLQYSLFTNAKDWVTKEDADIYQKIIEFNPFQNSPCNWFDEKWMFGINDGFDIVIGNPPYIKEYTNKSAFDGFRKSKHYQGKMDLWYGFASVLIDKLKPNGLQCFIAQNNWITSAGASKLRDKILSDTKIISFTDFGNYKVFASAGIQTMIYLIQKVKIKSGETYPIRYSILKNENLPEEELADFLDFNFISNDAQKYLFNITSTSNNAKPLTFNTNEYETILDEIASVANYYFTPQEVAQGIVLPQDFLNKANLDKLEGEYFYNEGIFALTNEELNKLNLTSKEKELIKPYYTTENFKKYYANPENKLWIIYTDSTFKNPKNILPYPNIKAHLDRFEKVITSDNHPYGLHRAREERFFMGDKIIVQRKCPKKPVFTYSDFDCYVSATFYVIKSFNGKHKYLTALLNSNLIEYWLRNKGKMQGNNFQLDKEPILNIPLLIPVDVTQFEILVDYLLYLYDDSKPDIFTHTDNVRIATHIERILNMMIYELYFMNHMKEVGIDVSPFISAVSFTQNMKDPEKEEIIKSFYSWFQMPENPVRQRMILVDTRSDDKIAIINKSTI